MTIVVSNNITNIQQGDAASARADRLLAESAATSATSSAGSATSSAADALSYKNSAKASLDAVNAQWLGSYAVRPTVDGSGNPLTASALGYNTAIGRFESYDGASWNIFYKTGTTNGAPSPSTGADGDTLIDPATQILYSKASGVWSSATLKGNNGTASVSSYTFATIPDPVALGAGALIFISNERFGPVIAESDGTVWRRTSDGRPAQSPAINYYVDSVSGNDSNTGTSAGAPLQTLNGVKTKVAALLSYRQQGLWIAFKDGSTFNEAPWTLAANHAGMVFTNYGATAGSVRPIFDCSAALTNASFVASGAYAGCYDYTLPITSQPSALPSNVPRVWRNGTCLTYVSTATACQALPGTFYHAAVATNATSVPILVNTGTDPTTDGAAYLAPRYYAAIDAYLAEGCEFRNLVGKQPEGSYGVFVGGRYCLFANCYVERGGTHCYFSRAGSKFVDCIGQNVYGAWAGSETIFVVYEPSTMPVDNDFTYERCRAIQLENWTQVPFAITNVSIGATCIVTAPGHTFTNNQHIDIADVVGTTEVNGIRYRIDSVVAGTSFRLSKYAPATSSNALLNSSAFTAYVSGGTARLSAIENTTVGFYNHGGSTFRNAFYRNCYTLNCSVPISCANIEEIVVEDCLFEQFKTCFKSGNRVYWNNNKAVNIPLVVSAIMAQSDGVGAEFYVTGGSAKIDSTGQFSMTHANTTLKIRDFTAKGFVTIARGNQANQTFEVTTVDDQINTNITNGDRYSQTNATGLSWTSDRNNFNGGTQGYTIGNVNYANLAAAQAAGYDKYSKA